MTGKEGTAATMKESRSCFPAHPRLFDVQAPEVSIFQPSKNLYQLFSSFPHELFSYRPVVQERNLFI